MSLNRVTALRKPVANNNFFISQLKIISPKYCLVFIFMDLHLVLLSQSQSSSTSLGFAKFCFKFTMVL